MTRIEVEIGELVLRGVPHSDAAAVSALVAARIEALAGGGRSDGAGGEHQALVDQVAHAVWGEVRDSVGQARGGAAR